MPWTGRDNSDARWLFWLAMNPTDAAIDTLPAALKTQGRRVLTLMRSGLAPSSGTHKGRAWALVQQVQDGG